MARACELTGKKPITGFRVSKSHHKTKRRFLPNLKTKRYFVPELNKWMTLKVSTSAMRTINKKGLYNYLKELEQKRELQVS